MFGNFIIAAHGVVMSEMACARKSLRMPLLFFPEFAMNDVHCKLNVLLIFFPQGHRQSGRLNAGHHRAAGAGSRNL